MKKCLALFGLMSPITFFAFMGLLIPQGLMITVVAFGGAAALFLGVGALMLQFIFGFIVQSGLSPMELLLGL